MKLSFVIVEYHSVEDILACSSSIQENMEKTSYQFEIIVSSNSLYNSEKRKQLLAVHSVVKWIFNAENGGFAYAMNQGLKVATGDILVIMNPDVRLKSGIGEMVEYFAAHEKIGLIAPMIRNTLGDIQDSYRHFITPWRFLVRHLVRVIGQKKLKKYDNPVNMDWVCGAFMMMSRASYTFAKGLDDGYFLYCEDMDLCKRMWLGGYKVIYYPMAEIEYEGTRSARVSSLYNTSLRALYILSILLGFINIAACPTTSGNEEILLVTVGMLYVIDSKTGRPNPS